MARRQKGGGFLEVTYAILVLVLVAGIILAVLGALGQLTPHAGPAPTPTIHGTGYSNLTLPAYKPGIADMGTLLISPQTSLHYGINGNGYDGVNFIGSFTYTVDPTTIPPDYIFLVTATAYPKNGPAVTNSISQGSVSNNNSNVSRTSPTITFDALVPFSSSYPSGPTFTADQLSGVGITISIVDSTSKVYETNQTGVPIPSS